jgi:DNA-binding NtrC family response regulator
MKRLYPDFPVLLVDDEEGILKSLEKVLTAHGINNIITEMDSREVIPLLKNKRIEAILLDIQMPHITGDILLKDIQEEYPEIPVIIVTASDDVNTAITCMKAGAFDYMVKAVEPNRLVSGLNKAITMNHIHRRYSDLRKHFLSHEIQHPRYFEKIVTQNRKMQAIFVFIESIAATSETILIRGDTGTGKELIAESIHRASQREGELVKVNVAGLDDTMFSDTLFGHTKGAFTGADAKRKGLIQQAENGTLFLDEIGDLPVPSQIKLLRLLESHEYYPVGSDLKRTTSARFVVATHVNLAEAIEKGTFRKDLYYRLQTYEITLPPLCQRREDLLLLVHYFLDEAVLTLNKKRLSLPRELPTLLETYNFPGNIRELRSMVFKAVTQQTNKMLSLKPFREAMGIGSEIKSPEIEKCEIEFPLKLPTIKQITEMVINEALIRSKGNHAIAAGLLGISPQALSKRLARKRNL